MQITKLRAKNFKSLVDFSLDLSKFTCLIGLNGAGKSTVLQFIDFLAQLVRGDIRRWLEERKWQAKDMKSKLTHKNNIDFIVHMTQRSGEKAKWSGTFNPVRLHCTQEQVIVGEAFLTVLDNMVSYRKEVHSPPEPTDRNSSRREIDFTYEGSILSQLKDSALPHPLLGLKHFLRSISSLDLMSPEHLYQRTRESGGSMGLGGRRLSAFLHELGRQERDRLVERLKKVHPQIVGLHTKALRSGWKQLEINESYRGEKSELFPLMTTEARHVADGMLRLIAILAETQTKHQFLLFDEIENGMNPEVVEFLLDALVSADQQVVVTTHSPTILNYLEDDVAQKGVLYLYKTYKGCTRAIRFFDIPSVAQKLTVMGPGEAFADTDLTNLQAEIEAGKEEQ